MTRRAGDIAKSIELMLLRPRATPSDCAALCRAGLEHHVAAVCVPPTHVPAAAALLFTCGSTGIASAIIDGPCGPLIRYNLPTGLALDNTGAARLVESLAMHPQAPWEVGGLVSRTGPLAPGRCSTWIEVG